jgi:hypothetical protein
MKLFPLDADKFECPICHKIEAQADKCWVMFRQRNDEQDGRKHLKTRNTECCKACMEKTIEFVITLEEIGGNKDEHATNKSRPESPAAAPSE